MLISNKELHEDNYVTTLRIDDNARVFEVFIDREFNFDDHI